MLGFGCRVDDNGCLDDAVTTFSDLIAHYQEQGQPTTNYQKGGQPLKRGQFLVLAFHYSNMKTILSTLDWPY